MIRWFVISLILAVSTATAGPSDYKTWPLVTIEDDEGSGDFIPEVEAFLANKYLVCESTRETALFYSKKVDYYGKILSRDEVVRERVNNQWPVCDLTLDARSLKVREGPQKGNEQYYYMEFRYTYKLSGKAGLKRGVKWIALLTSNNSIDREHGHHIIHKEAEIHK